MTLNDIMKALDTLSDDELNQIQSHIQQKRMSDSKKHDLSAYEGLSNNQLWEVVNTPFDVILDRRLRALTEQRQMGHLSEAEQQEVLNLLEALDKFILKRSLAMATLQKRGVDVMGDLSGR
ncbi:MAG: hypothetical protein SFZ02_06010 [bacterium]|nr:hypothetical protein [bacterium]